MKFFFVLVVRLRHSCPPHILRLLHPTLNFNHMKCKMAEHTSERDILQTKGKKKKDVKGKTSERKKEENKVITIIIICNISYDAPLNSGAEKRVHDGRMKEKNQ